MLGSAGFVQAGRELAQSHGKPARKGSALPFFPRLRENIGEWLLDNIHLVVAQTREVHDGLPRRYFRGLPVLAGGPLAGLPRVYALAWAYVTHADGAFTPALLVDFLQAYQSVHTLTQGELWALPTTMRVVLVENLRRLAERVATEESAREAAHTLCDGLDGPTEAAAVQPQALFARLHSRGVMHAFALQVMQRLHADSETGTARGARAREAVRRLHRQLPVRRVAVVRDGVRRFEAVLRDALLPVQVA